MASHPCPACDRRTTKILSNISPVPGVTYYRCDTCGHVWVTFADSSELHHVTPLKDAGQQR